MRRIYTIGLLVLTGSFTFECTSPKQVKPNIILIMADDLGYGDIQAFNQESEIPTPNINDLAEQGMIFTDVHTPSSICTPTRYGLLTGRYCWRSRLKKGVLRGYDTPLIEENRNTMANYLKDAGYRTGIVGKWHLGLGFQKVEGDRFDLYKPLIHSPNDHGFDYSFVLPASLDFEPYLYVKNKLVVDSEFDSVPTTTFPYFWREGVKSKSLEFVEVLDDLLDESLSFIKREAASAEPFFLYFPLTAPHKPVIPTEQFVGVSGKGLYGDFVTQIDWTVGEVIGLLDSLEILNNTLVIFTSDNGSPMYRMDEAQGADHVTTDSLAYYNASSHKANGALRGIKGDVYEGGHRVPFIMHWPEKIVPRQKVDEAICLTDLFKTLAEITGQSVSEKDAEDSYSFYPLITGSKAETNRPPIIHHSGGPGMFAIRDGEWKMIFGNGSGARTKPAGTPFQKPYQVYNLEDDLVEANNLIDKEKKIAQQLEARFLEIKGTD